MANRNKKVQDKYMKSKNFKSRGNKGYSKDECDTNSKKSYNDLSWYVTDPQILADVARIPYSIPVGYPLSRRGAATDYLIPAGFDDAIPGIAVMGIIPTIGNAEHADDAVNVAANGMYTFVRHLNSGSRNYYNNDLIIYCMAVNSVYYMISWCTRLYATLTLYAQGNRYLPDALLAAQRVDAADLRRNMAQFRAEVNQRIRKISTLVVPGVLPIFARHSWLFSNYFIEGESIKDQIYMFAPDAWYKYDLDNDSAGMLKCMFLRGTGGDGLLLASDLIQILDEMIDPIFADEDFNIISGDILKAYGEANILKLGLIPDELPIGLAHEEEVLLQFKNAKVAPVTHTSTSGTGVLARKFVDDMFDVVQDSTKQYIQVLRSVNAISSIQDFDGSQINYASVGDEASRIRQAYFNEWSKATLLSSPHATVEPGENMINTRLVVAFSIDYDSVEDNPNHVTVDAMYFGSEWPRYCAYYTYHRDKSTGVNSLFKREIPRVKMITPSSSTSVDACVHSFLPIRSSFKYSPELSIIENQSYTDGDEQRVVQVIESGRSIFEVDNYTLVSPEVIGLLHNAAIQGEYNIPRIALFATK